MPPIDPSLLTTGSEWQVTLGPEAGPNAAPDAAPESGAQFGGVLADKLGELNALQQDATAQAEALATGQATDPTSVVMAVEKARLSMQLASQIRVKATEAINDIFHTQV
jgi:flagellar hook-basal body complex protein FliE